MSQPGVGYAVSHGEKIARINTICLNELLSYGRPEGVPLFP